MEWLTCIKKTIEYIEDNLLEDIDISKISNNVAISPMFLSEGFKVMTGYSIGEYIRNRRLYNSAIEITKNQDKIIDIAYMYHYDTPESFTKAFMRFHGSTPRDIKANKAPIKSFLPLKINICITGGYNMEYTIKNLDGFKVIGFYKEFKMEEAKELIPLFWDEVFSKYALNIEKGNKPENEYEKALLENHIGEYGICIDSNKCNTLTYLIAGKYEGGNIPDGMMLYEFKHGEWAIFDCIGKMPTSIQQLSDRIYKEWLPANPDFDLCGNANVEWYDPLKHDNQANDYHSQVWIPVNRKNR